MTGSELHASHITKVGVAFVLWIEGWWRLASSGGEAGTGE